MRKHLTPQIDHQRIAATAGVGVRGAAAHRAQKYGLVPPDHGGIYGPGETLTYAAQRLLTRHSLAREFPRTRFRKSLSRTRPPRRMTSSSASRPEDLPTGALR